jgi:Na+/H+ antiporter NhaD/arsenite permease-like protein
LIGGSIARVVYRGRVQLAFLVALVASANAGGAGSVLGDTTTTMMWIAGKSPLDVIDATVGSLAAFAIFGVLAALQQHRHEPIARDEIDDRPLDMPRLVIVAAMLVGALLANIFLDFPAVGVWIALLVFAPLRQPAWRDIPHAAAGAAFLLALVVSASLMPVEQLPAASWSSTLALGFISAVFDNIPLTKLALDQGGYDWGFLAYAVGFGGSMMWFGSSAGVALAVLFPEMRSVTGWLKAGWCIPIAYVAGFFAMLAVLGWSATP